METRRIKISEIVPNEGQIAGLPTNPRQWTKGEMDNLKKSLQETPELFDARGILVYPYDGKFVVLGGNMRLAASKSLKYKDVPCIIVPEDTSVDKLKEIVIKDNGSFGEWDYDLLANEWDDLPLVDWGVPAWETKGGVSPDDFGEEFSLKNEQRSDYKQISFSLPIIEAEQVLQVVELAKYSDRFPKETDDENSNGLALSLIVGDWLEQMKASLEEKGKRITEEDLRKELNNALKRSGVTMTEVNKILGNQMAGHYFNPSQWIFPTKENFLKMSQIITFERSYEEMRDDYYVARISDSILKIGSL